MPLPHSCSLIANLGQVGPVSAGVLDSRTVFLSSVSGFCWGIIWMRMRSHLHLGSGRGVCCHHFQAYEFSVPFWRVFRFSRLPFKYPICIPWCLQKKHLLSIWDESPNESCSENVQPWLISRFLFWAYDAWPICQGRLHHQCTRKKHRHVLTIF